MTFIVLFLLLFICDSRCPHAVSLTFFKFSVTAAGSTGNLGKLAVCVVAFPRISKTEDVMGKRGGHHAATVAALFFVSSFI